LVDLLKYLRSICGETSPSEGGGSTGGCGTALVDGMMEAAFAGTDGVGANVGNAAACAIFTGAAVDAGTGTGAGAGTGKTNRFVPGRITAEKRNDTGPTTGKYPGPGDAAAVAIKEVMRTKNKLCQFQNRRFFMGLISLFFKTFIRWSIDSLGANFSYSRAQVPPECDDQTS
jgi:hypothetical protein